MFKRKNTQHNSPFTSQNLEKVFVPMTNNHGEVIGMTDNQTFEYLKSQAPVPTQQSLDAMLAKVTRVRIIDGGVYKDRALGTQTLFDITDTQSIIGLRNSLAIIEDKNTFSHCTCDGDYAIEFYKGKRLITTIGLHHGSSIRWDAWKYDALLKDGLQLLNWLADKGLEAPLKEYLLYWQHIMTHEEALQKFGLPALPHYRDEIRQLLAKEIELDRKGKSSAEMLRTLSLQLFSIGMVEDSLLIWEAKQSSFDASFTVDIQTICGSGLTETKEYLAQLTDPSAKEALEYLIECEQAGDFRGWKPQSSIDTYREYYALS